MFLLFKTNVVVAIDRAHGKDRYEIKKKTKLKKKKEKERKTKKREVY